jgi:hypothetical protein
VVEPEPSEALAGAEGQAPPAGASADAAEKGGEPQEAQADALSTDRTPSSLARLSTPDGENGLDDAGPDSDAAAAGSGRSGVGFAEREEALASVPEVKEPRVRLQRDSVVMRAQGLLAKLDLYRDAIDGLLGERTMAAIRKFQKSVSMAETGKVSETLLAALEAQVEAMEARSSSVSSDFSGGQRGQSSGDAAVEAAETLQVIDIMTECRGKEAEWVYIAAINRHVLCGGLSAESPD